MGDKPIRQEPKKKKKEVQKEAVAANKDETGNMGYWEIWGNEGNGRFL